MSTESQINTETLPSSKIVMDALHSFLKDPTYADHRKLTAATLLLLVLIGMLFV